METLEKSYRQHRRYEHILTDPQNVDGILQDAQTVVGVRPSEQGLSIV